MKINQETDIKTEILELRQKYARLAFNCRAAGIKVNRETIQDYIRRLQELERSLG